MDNPENTNVPPPIIPSPPPVVSDFEDKRSFSKQAAWFSVLAPLVNFIVNVSFRPETRGSWIGQMILGCTCALIILAAFVFGIVALVNTRKVGKEGIFGKALAGVIINGILIFFIAISIPAFKRAVENTREKEQQRMEQNR